MPWNGHYEDVTKREEVAPIINGNSNGDYYVTYEHRPVATQGGDSSLANNYSDEPTVTKSSTENPNTGTNTISLEVQGKRKTDKQKADIIVIYDVSGSMKFPIEFNSMTYTGSDATVNFVDESDPRQRNGIVKKAIKDLATELMADQTGSDPAVRMAIVPFSTNAGTVVSFTGDEDIFNKAVDSLALGGGTNWEAALQAANAMHVRSDADTYVIFVTDGNPTFRITRNGETDAQINKQIKNGIKSGIVDAYYNEYGIFGTGNTDADKTSLESITNNYQSALAIVQSIVESNKILYGIGISPEAPQLGNLIADSKSDGKYYDAESSGEVTNAINDIKHQIKEKTFGYSDVKINDGITALTQTVQKTGMTTLPDSDDFEYFKGHEATQEEVNAGKATDVGETVWEPWTPQQMEKEGAGRASYNTGTGSVEWNLGDQFMLEDGVSYKVDFTVWPSQEALDILADINNSCRRDQTTGKLTTYATPDDAYESLPEEIRSQITKSSGKYILKTNTDTAGYSYKKATKEGEDGAVTPHGDPVSKTFDPVIPLKLRTDKIGVEKSFSNLLDSRDPTQIQLELWGDRLFKTFTLTKEGSWKSDNNYISCGLLTVDKNTGAVYVYETGHDFTLKETGPDSIYWELTADTYHPMIINDVLHVLSKVDAPADMPAEAQYYSEGGKEYYRVGETVYKDEGTDAVLKATNDHRSFLDLSKAVVDDKNKTVNTDDLFTFKARFVESRAEDDIIFTVYDTVKKEYVSDQSITTAALTPADDAANTTPYFKAANKTEFTLKIKQGWNVRFLNLSNGTTYNIEEVLGEDSKYEFKKIEGSAIKTNKDKTTADVENSMTITSGQTAMSGKIGEPNVQYSVKYTNKKLSDSTKVLLRKLD